MKRVILVGFIFFSFLGRAQTNHSKLGAYTSLDAAIGFDLAGLIKSGQANTEYEKSQVPPGEFTFGFSLLAGYQPLSWFAMSGGLRYSYITPSYHLVYYKVQPNFFVGGADDDDFFYFFANFGTKVNTSKAKKAGFLGIGAGKIEPLSSRMGHQFQISIDDQVIDGEATVFVGISYGIIIFSNIKR